MTIYQLLTFYWVFAGGVLTSALFYKILDLHNSSVWEKVILFITTTLIVYILAPLLFIVFLGKTLYNINTL